MVVGGRGFEDRIRREDGWVLTIVMHVHVKDASSHPTNQSIGPKPRQKHTNLVLDDLEHGRFLRPRTVDRRQRLDVVCWRVSCWWCCE